MTTVIETDYLQELNLAQGERLQIPTPEFTEVRVPRLSENTTIDDTIKEQIQGIGDFFPIYYPKEQKGVSRDMHLPAFVYIADESAEKRNTLAACILNYVIDRIDHRNKTAPPDLRVDFEVLQVDARQTLGEQTPTDVIDNQGRVRTLMPLPYPEPQRVNYFHKIQHAAQCIAQNPGRLYVLVLPDMDEIISDEEHGWTNTGRHVLGKLEMLAGHPNFLIIGTLNPYPLILFGDKRYAGLNKTPNLVINDWEKDIQRKIKSAAALYYRRFGTQESLTVHEAAEMDGVTGTEVNSYIADHAGDGIGMPENREDALRYFKNLRAYPVTKAEILRSMHGEFDSDGPVRFTFDVDKEEYYSGIIEELKQYGEILPISLENAFLPVWIDVSDRTIAERLIRRVYDEGIEGVFGMFTCPQGEEVHFDD